MFVRRWPELSLLLAALTLSWVSRTMAAEPEFVGVLAVAVDSQVMDQLDLSPEQRTALRQVVDQREIAALELALSLKDAPPAERDSRLAPFRSESERQGLAILSDPQRRKLERLRVQRKGMRSLLEEGIGQKLQLRDAQRAEIQRLEDERRAAIFKAQDAERSVIDANFERRLFGVLDPPQRAAWEQLASADAPPAMIPAPAAGYPANAPVAQSAPAQPGVAQQGTGKEPPAVPGKDTAENAAATTPERKVPTEKLQFSFKFQPWGDVLEWLAEQADLSLLMDAPPPGTFNYTDSRSYSLAEAIDLLNSVLLTKGYTLVRRERMLMVVNLEDGIPPNLVPFVPLEKLDTKGDFELVSVLFPLHRMTPDDARAEVERLLGPQGSLFPLNKAGMLQVTETAGRLRMIHAVLNAADGESEPSTSDMQVFTIQHAYPDEVLAIIRQLLDIPAEGFASADGSVRLAVDALNGKLFVTGRPEKLQRVEEIMKTVDVAVPGTEGPTVIETPQLEVYPIASSDPNSVLQVLQTLMANAPEVRLALDPATGSLIAYARPSQHATILATINQMQRDGRVVEVIHLQTVDPQLAMLSINKLFGVEGDKPSATAPKVEADPLTRQLLIRGSAAQVTQIRELLEKMGESGATTATALLPQHGGTVRMIPLTGRNAQVAIERLEALWPALRSNKIRVVSPSKGVPAIRPGEQSSPATVSPELLEMLKRLHPPSEPQPAPPIEPQSTRPNTPLPNSNAPPATTPALPKDRSAARGAASAFAVFRQPAKSPAGATQQSPGLAKADSQAEKPPIIVLPGPGGIMIVSEDEEALDEFEALLATLGSSTFSGKNQFTIFYLRNSSAAVVAEVLTQIFGSATGTGGSSGGSLLGDLAGAALGDVGGGLVSGLLGAGGGGPSLLGGSVMIVPETRLNALIVQAGPQDLDTIEQLLVVLDQQDVPESVVAPRPRMIPVFNTSASAIADILREVYQEHLVSTNRNRQPSPEEFIQLLRGGRGGGSSRGTQAQAQKMTISVDTRTNALIVAAPEVMFEEVRLLVETLDHATTDSNQTMRAVVVKRTNPETLQKALSAIAGDKLKTGGVGESASGGSSSAPSMGGLGMPGFSPDPMQMQDQMRQRIEMFNALRGMSGGSRGGDSGRPPSGSFGPPRPSGR